MAVPMPAKQVLPYFARIPACWDNPAIQSRKVKMKMSKLDNTRQLIEEALNGAQRPVLLLSGGKDSLLLLELCEPFRQRLHLVWARTSEVFPHMRDFMRQRTQGWDFKELSSDQAAYFARKGLPSAIIPVRQRPHEKPVGVMIQSAGYCCKDLQYRPLVRYVRQYGADVLLHGQTAEDLRNLRLSVPGLFKSLKQTRLVAPLADWLSDEVMAYCRTQGVALPLQYLTGFEDSLECWNCTVRTDLKRFQWMQQHCPELASRLGEMMQSVYGTVIADYNTHIKPILDVVETPVEPQ